MMNLHTYLGPIAGRLVYSILTLWAITILFFAAAELMPGDFASATATRDTTRAMIEATRHELGLFASAPQRYVDWLGGFLTGDLGESWWLRKPITGFIGDRLWHSAWLVGWAAAFTVPLALCLALAAVAWRRSLFDRAASMAALTAMSFPDFLVAYALMALLTVKFRLFPVFTIFSHDMSVADRLHASALPILALAAVTITPIFRLSRAALINVLNTEYVQTAYLKGLGRWRVLLWHALPNAVGPIANTIVLSLANLFFGLLVIETIFQYPGMGHLLLTAVSNRDIPLVQACALITAVIYITLSFSADALTILTSPKLRHPATPANTRWIPRQWTNAIRTNWKLSTTTALFAVVLIGAATMYFEERVEQTAWARFPPPSEQTRTELTAAQLLDASPNPASFVHYDYFKPFGTALPAKHRLQGELRIPRFLAQRRRADQETATATGHFPGFAMQVVLERNVMLPVDHARLIASTDAKWYIIPSPGRTWHEPADGDWSRASFAFTLTGVRDYAPRYGVAAFLFNDHAISQVRIQIAEETANWSQVDIWGQTEAELEMKPVEGGEAARNDFASAAAGLLDVRPWSELSLQHWRSLEIFDGRGNRHNVSASGLMVDDVFYLRPCRTRAGLHPYCRQIRFGVFSVSKSLGAAVAMLWLAEKYGPQVFDEKITNHVTIPAEHDGWKDVTFGNALDMASGIGNVMPYRVDEYVEADQTQISNRVWAARSIRDKLNAMAQFNNYPWAPGEVTRYRSSDTTALTAAMEAYLRSKEGRDADLWQSLTKAVFEPLGINRIPVRRTIEPDGRPGTPLLAAGMFPTIEEALKLARLLQDHGEYQGRQLLHRDLTRRAVSIGMSRGLPTGWHYAEGGEAHYDKSFWLTPHKTGLSCNVRIPVMAGFGGNYVFIMPNRTIGLRFADGHDDDPHTWNSYGIRKVSDRVRPFCS